jgi:hypothetical protein
MTSGNPDLARNAEYGGNPREAIRALLAKVAFLEAARDRALDLVSFGYARGKLVDPWLSRHSERHGITVGASQRAALWAVATA